MSTEIGKVKGILGTVVVNRYYAGEKHGPAVQLTFELQRDFVQFNMEQLGQLTALLHQVTGDKKDPWVHVTKGQLEKWADALRRSGNSDTLLNLLDELNAVIEETP